MAQFDSAKAARVWQRVQDTPKSQAEDLRPLIQEVQSLAAVYRQVSAQTSGRIKGLLATLHEDALRDMAALKGLQHLRGGLLPRANALPGNSSPAVKALEKCYHRSRRLAGEYTARSVDPEWGMVFAVLADRARVNCALTAEIIGELAR